MIELDPDKLETIARALVWSAWFARYALEPGEPQQEPTVGDLVFEWTALHTPPYVDKVGWWVGSNAIETLDGRIVQWENCLFKKVPEGLDFKNKLHL